MKIIPYFLFTFFIAFFNGDVIFKGKMWYFTAVYTFKNGKKISFRDNRNRKVNNINGEGKDIKRLTDRIGNFVECSNKGFFYYTKRKLSPYDLSYIGEAEKPYIYEKYTIIDKGSPNGYRKYEMTGIELREMIDRKTGKVKILELPINTLFEIIFNDKYFLIVSFDEARKFIFYVKEEALKNENRSVLSKEKMNKLWIESIKKYCSQKEFILEGY